MLNLSIVVMSAMWEFFGWLAGMPYEACRNLCAGILIGFGIGSWIAEG